MELTFLKMSFASEPRPNQTLGSHPISIVEAAKSLGLTADFSQPSLKKLPSVVNKGFPAIAFIVKITEDFFYHHAVVIEEISKTQVTILDPEEGRTTVDRSDFELAWSAAGNLAILIQTK
jgi:ABC-type bacteriocin/lantibiotic exporter with double-glycine peptidase domain